MTKGLVIVESPAKAKTIQKYLGKGFTVEASLGHVKDLPKSTLGVDVDNNFDTEYVVIPGKEKVVARLKKLAIGMDTIYLAPDPDREGEAIAAHLAEELGDDSNGKKKKKKTKKGAEPEPDRIRRVTFNEITQRAVREAFEHPRDIDQNLVDAQQARRVLDRLVGYQVSPLLWDKVRRGLSAGRVQTVALRLIVEREREIKAFEKKEYWTIDANLAGPKPPAFDARFLGKGEEKIEVTNGDDAEKIRAALENADWLVRTVDRKERRRNATPPFTTSKLQQDSSRKLRFSVKRTMMIAQRLYEGVELGEEGLVGLITYMRTDSVRVSNEALTEVREYIKSQYGDQYLPEAPNTYKEKKAAQAAHEAIRPSSVVRHPDQIKQYLKEDEYKVYKLIWQRFVASQITPAVFDQTTVDIVAKADRNYDFRVTGSVLKFDGFLKVYEEAKDKKDEDDEALANKLPALDEGQSLNLNQLKPEQHYTEPPPRYNEASLVKELEEQGIGRPSTYASIINTIQDREYVQKIGGRAGRFVPTEIGTVVTDLLVKNFPYIFDTKYTAKLETELDDIEDGREKWTDLLSGFYSHFADELKDASKHMEDIKRMEKPTDEKCPVCGSPLVLKWGKFGSFYACSSYDKKKKDSCTYTRENFESKPNLNLPEGQEAEKEEEYCENCGRVMVLRNGPWGPFMACPGYNEDPPCKTVRRLNQKQQQKPPEPINEDCPKCGSQLVKRMGQYGEFVSCSAYPKCKYIKQNTIGVLCPKCKDGQIVEKKARRGNLFYGCENYPKCDFTANFKPVDKKCPECGSPYLMEKTLKSGVYLVCPNSRKPAAADEEESPKKRKKKGEEESTVVCAYSKRIGDAPVQEKPTVETHGPLVEQTVS